MDLRCWFVSLMHSVLGPTVRVNSEKWHGLETATWELCKNGDKRLMSCRNSNNDTGTFKIETYQALNFRLRTWITLLTGLPLYFPVNDKKFMWWHSFHTVIHLSDTISYGTFCDIMRKEKPVTKESLLRAFKKFDINGDGYVTHDELTKMLTMVCFLCTSFLKVFVAYTRMRLYRPFGKPKGLYNLVLM